jgi:hypothetical protein
MSRRILAAALLGAGWLAAADLAADSPTCSLAGEHLMSWPTGNPVWEFCWLRPADSSAPNGSGLEIRNVYYNGHLVMKRGHIPILNVLYDPGGCGCFRDWLSQEVVFQADNVISPGYAEPTTPPMTVCDVGGSQGDIGSFMGVAAEKLADRLILTTQASAGWYRYTIKWRFFLDGRIEPVMGFAAVNSGCIASTHRHHAYWRLDWDIDGPGDVVARETLRPAFTPNPGTPGPPPVLFPTEAMRLNTDGGRSWSVSNSVTGRGYNVIPGEEVELPVDSFAVGDVWFLNYRASELDDASVGGNPCPIRISSFVNGEATATDIVMWYRGGAYHEGGDLDDCHWVGPTLVPFGDWSP